MNYVIFEDNAWKNFLPFTYTRFTGDLRSGILKQRKRIGLYFDFEPTKIALRDGIKNLYRRRHQHWQINDFRYGEYTFINSRLKVNKDDTVYEMIQALKIGQKLVLTLDTPLRGTNMLDKQDDLYEVLAFKINIAVDFECSTENIFHLYSKLEAIESTQKDVLWNYTWEFLEENRNLIKDDYHMVFYEADNFMEIDPGVVAINPYEIWIGEGAVLKHGVILDASEGPVIIDENAVIMHNAVILGPAYIGKNSHVKIGTKMYGGTSVGPNCKIGGEVTDTIFQAFSNKQHAGYLGKSYIGEWVNLGAGTSNSDLKNSYKSIKVWNISQKKNIPTDNLFMGTFIGDHSKIGINCSINTGSVIGFGVNIYGRDLIKNFVPSFSFGEADKLSIYEIDRFIETAIIVKKRRNREVIREEIDLIMNIYENYNTIEDKL